MNLTNIREERWFKNEQNAIELEKILTNPILMEAVAILREKARPRRSDVQLPDELGDTAREKAATAFHALAGYEKFWDDLCVLAGTIPEIHELSPPWGGPHVLKHSEQQS